jgi:hypothetical protein
MIAIWVLYNDDINMILLDKAIKDKTQGLLLIKSLKIFKRDYLVKILEVSLNIWVAYEKGIDNS